MKVKVVQVEFEKRITAMVAVPEGWTTGQIRALAASTASYDLDEWWQPDWTSWVSREQVKEVDEQALNGMVVASDDGETLVSPCDASWWKDVGGAK